ncbi:TPA: hypothetical protein ACFNMH_001832 [Neisseria elongata]
MPHPCISDMPAVRIRPSARQLLTAEFDFAAKRNAENNRGRLKTKLSDGLG